MAVLLEQSGIFLELCAQPDAHVACAAALCLVDMVRGGWKSEGVSGMSPLLQQCCFKSCSQFGNTCSVSPELKKLSRT